jgi:(p)ppGpp synthase/HD superfamily hydrolase
MSIAAELLDALLFAARKHRAQRRKDEEASPYINHPIEVAQLLATVGEVTDLATLQAAILHDTLEDTDATADEIDERFGPRVLALVRELSDDKSLPKQVRKELQVKHAATASHGAKLVKLGDKISNVRDMAHSPPRDWPLERQREYLTWCARVVDGCRGANPALEARFDEVLRDGRVRLDERR